MSAEDIVNNYDFAGWVTYNDIRCADGAIIKQSAFSGNDGSVVNLTWNHKAKDDPRMVLGKMYLETYPEGTYGWGQFNNSDIGKHAKEMVIHGDVNAMSIGANRIKRDPINPSNVIGGNIYEVSLVQSGANPAATIQEVVMHGEDYGSSIIFENGLEISTYLEHSAQKGSYMSFRDTLEHSEDMNEILEHAEDILDTLDEEQAEAVAFLLGQAREDALEEGIEEGLEEGYHQGINDVLEDIEDDDEEEYEDDDEEEYEDDDEDIEEEIEQGYYGGELMRHNIFQQNSVLEHSIAAANDRENVKEFILDALEEIQHSDVTLNGYIGELRTGGEYERADLLEHALNNVELLFPEYTTVNGVQFLYSKDTATERIMTGVTKYPTSFIRTLAADLSDLSDEDLRAKGYIKGDQKKEQLFGFIERKTEPQTIYKKQSIDRDDQIDMSKNLDVQLLYRSELKTKINDEIARAILVGDGRAVSSRDKVKEDRIRPIKTDDDFFTIKAQFDPEHLETLSETIDLEMINMDGTGTPAMIISPRLITKIRHIKDKDGLFLYGGRTPASMKDLADLFGVSEIIKSKFLSDEEIIIVNLADYGIGHENGGELRSFEQFDIHVNKTYFLMETRLAGALTRPHSALYLSKTKQKANNKLVDAYNKKFPKTEAEDTRGRSGSTGPGSAGTGVGGVSGDSSSH